MVLGGGKPTHVFLACGLKLRTFLTIESHSKLAAPRQVAKWPARAAAAAAFPGKGEKADPFATSFAVDQLGLLGSEL